MKDHPIQLIHLINKELSIIVYDSVKAQSDNLEVDITYQIGSGKFDEDKNELVVGFRCSINEDMDSEIAPFKLITEILGVFRVGDEFPKEHIMSFAKQNVPFILMPYIRENVYSLASRTNVKIILPLVQIQ